MLELTSFNEVANEIRSIRVDMAMLNGQIMKLKNREESELAEYSKLVSEIAEVKRKLENLDFYVKNHSESADV